MQFEQCKDTAIKLTKRKSSKPLQTESITRIANRSVQPFFLHRSRHKVPILYSGCLFPMGDLEPRLIYYFFGLSKPITLDLDLYLSNNWQTSILEYHAQQHLHPFSRFCTDDRSVPILCNGTPLLMGIWTSIYYMVPWAHPSSQPKRHLDR